MENVKFERLSSIRIPKNYENDNFYKIIKKFLTRRTKNYNSDTYTTNIFYIETEKYLHIPRYFPIQDFVDCKVENMQNIGEDISIESNIIPRNVLQKNAITYMLEHDCGLLELQPGVGKTVISIKVISELKKKTIIFTHRDSLVYQWKNRLLEFTNLNEDDISVLTSKNFLKDLEKPIIISTVQTFISLIKRKYEEFIISLYKANIGISISDEVHTSVGAPTFSECSLYIPSLRNYGLSATPYRSDGNSDIINFHLGKTFSENDTSGTMPCKIYFVLFKCGVDLPNKKRYFYFAGTFQKSRYLNGIAKSEVLINLTTQILKRTYSDNRNIILVSERIKFLDEMMKIQDISEEDKGKFIAGSKNDILKKKIVFSTPGKIRDGVDIPEKDCLIMTSPISNISQIAGRVTRIYKDKKMPIIFDMVDIGSPPIRKTMLKRNDFYNEKGWEVKYILIGDNGEKSEISRNEAMKLI